MSQWLAGDPGKRGRKRAVRPVPPVVETFGPPEDLPELHLEVWNRYAPHAFQAGTLTSGTAGAFRDLCEAVVVRDALLSEVLLGGYLVGPLPVESSETPAKMPSAHRGVSKHPLLGEWRAVAQQVRTALKEFRLAPLGKPMVDQPTEPDDPFAEFDGSPVQ